MFSWSIRPIAELVLRNARHKPATRLYPRERRTPFPRTRGQIAFRIDDCDFCTICAHKCPTQAIVVHRTEKTWAIDHGRCILCSNCIEGCPNGCITLRNDPHPPLRAHEVLTFRKDHEPPPAPQAVAVAVPQA